MIIISMKMMKYAVFLCIGHAYSELASRIGLPMDRSDGMLLHKSEFTIRC